MYYYYYHVLFGQLSFEGVTNGKKCPENTLKQQVQVNSQRRSSNREFLDMLKKEGIGRRPTGINPA